MLAWKIKRSFAIFLVGIIILLMGIGVSTGRVGTLTWGPTTDFLAISIAISKIEFGLKGYLGYQEICQVLADHLSTAKSHIQVNDEGTRKLVNQPKLVSKAIAAAAKVRRVNLNPGPKELGGFNTTIAEDVGYVDFYELAFRLFGYNGTSTHYLYLLILGLSCGLFIAQYIKESIPIAAMTLAVTALFMVSNSGALRVSVPSIAANRFISTMALIPFLHITFSLIGTSKLTKKDLITTVCQSAILVFSVFCRSSAQWTIFTVLVFGLGLIIAKFLILKRPHQDLRIEQSETEHSSMPDRIDWFGRWRHSRFVLIPLILLCVFGGAKLYQNSQLDEIYFSDDLLPHHLIWHSAYMGLSLHPDWSKHLPCKELEGKAGDSIPFTLSQKLLHERGISGIGGATRNLHRMRLHDRVIRSAFFDFVMKNPRYISELYLYYKPLNILMWMGRLIASIPFFIWTIAFLSIAISAELVRTATTNFSKWKIYAILLTMTFFFSLLPNLWAYPASHVMADQIWAAIFVLLSISTMVVIMCFRWLGKGWDFINFKSKAVRAQI